MRIPYRAILAGVAATLIVFGAAELTARLIGPNAAPLLALSQAIIPLTPPGLIKPVIALFGSNDKLVLVLSTFLGALVIGALIGLLAARLPRVALLALVVAGLVPAAAILQRPGTGVPDIVPSLVGLGLGLVAFVLMLRSAGLASASVRSSSPTRAEATHDPSATPDPDAPAAGATPDPDATTTASMTEPSTTTRATHTPGSRRRFFALTGTLAAAGLAAAAAGQSMAALTREAAGNVARLVLPRPARTAPAIPASASVAVDGIRPFVTSAKDFYRIDTLLAPPTIDPAQWSLRIHGMVENEVILTMDELLALPLEEHHITLTCVSNPVGGSLLGTATWLGYPVRELLRRAKPQAGADMVLSHSFDGFTASTPLEVLEDERPALLAVGMNGSPLTPVHGFPARLVVPGLYGFVSATKWVTELELTRFEAKTAYWTDRGWDAKAPILVASRIDVPRPLAKLAAGEVVTGGSAWAQHRGVERVEVRLDDGGWQEAELAAEVNLDTWRQWSHTFPDVEPGVHSVTVRAVDQDGTVQTDERRESIPNTATGHHRIQFTVE